MSRRVILAGNAVTASILSNYIGSDARYEVVATVVSDEYVGKSQVQGVADCSLSEIERRFPRDGVSIIMAIGYNDLNRNRERMLASLKSMGFIIETYIHPEARIFSRNSFGEGCVILPGVVVEPHAKVGANSMIWCNTTLAHHSEVRENCWIASGAVISGQAVVGRNTFVGVNATVVNRVCVGEYNIIGAAALVTKDTKPQTVLLSRSAEPFRYTAEEYSKFVGM
jgi:sugar O-acyltransferase (sialic acid O-acetyltransferase NeuD family)